MSDEYIKREDAIKASTPAFRNAFSDWEVGWIESKDDTKDMIENLPSADVAPVVRCKDCKWSDACRVNGNMERWCERDIALKTVQDNDFCSCGERKDDD